MKSTYFGLLAEFGAAEIRLEDCCEKYFSLSIEKAKRKAALQQLPVKAYRVTASQKGHWLISAADLAELIDKRKAGAGKDHAAMNGASDSPDAGSRNAA